MEACDVAPQTGDAAVSTYISRNADGREVGIGVWQLPDRKRPSLVLITGENRVVASFGSKVDAVAFEVMLEDLLVLAKKATE